MNITLNIQQESAEELFRTILIQDYKSLVSDIKALKKKRKKQGLEFYEQQDLDNNVNFKNGIEIMLTYYLSHDEAQKVIKETHDA